MKNRFASALVVAAALLAGATQASLRDKKATINLDREAIVGETILAAGTYGLELAPGRESARFVSKRRTVAEVPCRVGLADVAYPGIAVHYRTGGVGPDRLIKIVISSSNLAIDFPRDGADRNDASLADAAKRP
jgi:hypothetical protein